MTRRAAPVPEAPVVEPAPDADMARRQGALIDKQILLTHEQLRHTRVQAFSERLGILLKLLTGLAGVAAAVALAALAIEAAGYHGLVVEAFSVPPDLAQRGVGGQVVAREILDKLTQLQDQTESARAAHSYRNDWGDELKVEIPETGVSIGELRRFLRDWLGHETRISGEVFHSPGGLTIAARAGQEAAHRFSGRDAALDKLTQQAAEAVFGRTQPYRYAVFLDSQGRYAEARAALERDLDSDDATERAWAELGLGTLTRDQGDMRGAIARFRQALREKPDLGLGWFALANASTRLGHDEDGLKASRVMAAAHGGLLNELTKRARIVLRLQMAAEVGELVGDYQGAAQQEARLAQLPAIYRDVAGRAASDQADDLLANHDVDGARAMYAGLHPDGGEAAVQAAYILDILEEPAAARAIAAAQPDEMARLKTPGPLTASLTFAPTLAAAMARAGDLAGARALIARTPLDCYLCVYTRGRVASAGRDWAGADRWFAEAVRQAPSIPFAYAEWARSLMARGDPAGAVAKLRQARRVSPHWPDAPFLWGEALMQQGRPAAALAMYAAADRSSPHWGRNHLRWGQALWATGRVQAARVQFATATGLALSTADRAALEVLRARIGA